MRSLFVRMANSDFGRALTIAAISACLLIPLLSQPLWRDEGSTFVDVSQPSLASVLDSMRLDELTPPLYFLLEHFWIRFAGTTEFALRVPSLIAIALAIALLYDTGRRVRDRIAGFASAACAGLAPISLFVGSEARAYALTLFFGALVMWLIAQLLFSPLPKAYPVAVLLAIATAAFCWTHYTAWPAVVALLIITPVIWTSSGSKRGLLLLAALVIGTATTLPMISTFASAAGSIHAQFDSNNDILQRIEARLVWFSPLLAIEPALSVFLAGGTLTWLLRLFLFSRRVALVPQDQFLTACLGVLAFGVGSSVERSLQTGHHLAAYAPAAWLILGNYYSRLVTWLCAGSCLRTLSVPRKGGLLTLAAVTIFAVCNFPFVYADELAPRSGSAALAHELKHLTAGDVVMIAVPDALSPALYYYLRDDARITVRGFAAWSEPWYYYYTTSWDSPSLKQHFRSLVGHAAATRSRLAFAVDWRAENYNGHRYDIALEIAREESTRRSIAFRHTYQGTVETMELILLAPSQPSASPPEASMAHNRTSSYTPALLRARH